MNWANVDLKPGDTVRRRRGCFELALQCEFSDGGAVWTLYREDANQFLQKVDTFVLPLVLPDTGGDTLNAAEDWANAWIPSNGG